MFTYFNNQGHGESVYNLIKTTETCPPNPPLYRSRFSQFVREEARSNKVGCTRTMGVPKNCLCPPDNYLRKNSRVPITVYPSGIPRVKLRVDTADCGDKEKSCASDQNQDSGNDNACEGKEDDSSQAVMTSCCQPKGFVRMCCKTEPRAPVPKSCCCVLGILPRGDKDFVRDNAVKVVRQRARIPEPRYVFHRNGHSANWTDSGYPRRFVCKKGFGEVPEYLECMKQRILAEDMERKCKLDQGTRDARDKCQHLPNAERDAIICGLKCKWEETFKEYQSMSLLIDTDAKIKQRVFLETKLKDLENNIQMFERHNHIFVADTDSSFYLA